MITPLYLEFHQRYVKAFDSEPTFFQLCIEHLGFLVTEHEFEFIPEYEHVTGELFRSARFFNQNNGLIFYIHWERHSLPTLSVGCTELKLDRKVFERGLLREFNRDAFAREWTNYNSEYNEQIEQKIKLMGNWVRENLIMLIELPVN